MDEQSGDSEEEETVVYVVTDAVVSCSKMAEQVVLLRCTSFWFSHIEICRENPIILR